MSEELRWHPPATDPAFDAAYDFVRRNQGTADDPRGIMWQGWMVRQAFWAGVRWARERAVPVAGTVGEDGKIQWKGPQP